MGEDATAFVAVANSLVLFVGFLAHSNSVKCSIANLHDSRISTAQSVQKIPNGFNSNAVPVLGQFVVKHKSSPIIKARRIISLSGISGSI